MSAFHPSKNILALPYAIEAPDEPVEETPDTLKVQSKIASGSKALPVPEALGDKTIALTEMLGSEADPYSDTVVPCPQPYSPQLMKLSFQPENV